MKENYKFYIKHKSKCLLSMKNEPQLYIFLELTNATYITNISSNLSLLLIAWHNSTLLHFSYIIKHIITSSYGSNFISVPKE